MPVRTALGNDFYIWHPQSGVQTDGTLYIVAHAERTMLVEGLTLPANTTMSFLCASGQNVLAEPIQNAFAKGGASPYGMASSKLVDNYNLFKSPSDASRPSGAVESYTTIGAIPDQQMISITSDILTVRKRAGSWTTHSGMPFAHRGTDLKQVFKDLQTAGHRYGRFMAYFCRGAPFRSASTTSAQYLQ